MERKLHAGDRPARSIARYDRPRLAVAPRTRTYMDVMAPGTAIVSSPRVAPAKSVVQLKPQPQQQPAKYFDVKPLVAPSQAVARIAPTIKPLTKTLSDIAPAPKPAVQLVEIPEPTPAPASELQPSNAPIPEVPETPIQPGSHEHSESAPKKKRRLKHLLKKPTKRRTLHGLAAVLFIAGMYVAVDGWIANQTVKTQASVLSAQVDENDGKQQEAEPTGRDALSETKPAGVGGYRVAADLPRAIKIPAIGVNARILQLGVKKDNSLAAPSNIYDTGWYTGSSKPGDPGGAVLIDGHVHGPTQKAVFFRLKQLKAGDEIALERGDGLVVTFAVRHVETVDVGQVDMLKLLNSVEPGTLGLNLITCGGTYDAENTEYKSRTLVYAVKK